MLKKINRSLKRADFERLREFGEIYQSPLFGLLVGETGETVNKFGIIASKKISKKAVERNKIRRLVYEGIRVKQKILGDKGYQIVFLAKKSLVGKKPGEIEGEVEKMFEEINKNEKNNLKTNKNL